MSATVIAILVLIWLLIGLATGGYIAYNNYRINGWPWPARFAVIMLGPITGLATLLYFVGWLVGAIVYLFSNSAAEFILGHKVW